MGKFYSEYPDAAFVQRSFAQISWLYNLEILIVKSQEERLWYINKTVENGWSKNIVKNKLNYILYYIKVIK